MRRRAARAVAAERARRELEKSRRESRLVWGPVQRAYRELVSGIVTPRWIFDAPVAPLPTRGADGVVTLVGVHGGRLVQIRIEEARKR